MKLTRYESDKIEQLVPLLEAIGREVEERETLLRGLEAQKRRWEQKQMEGSDDYLNLVAQIATHKRELRLVKRELDHLGCSLEGTRPLSVHIHTTDNRVFLWQPGEALRALVSLDA